MGSIREHSARVQPVAPSVSGKRDTTMIPRTLVPQGARPPADVEPTTRRRPTSLDERTLVPSTLPIVALNGHSTIPNNLPLEAIAARVVVPRDLNIEAVQKPDDSHLPAQPTDMDERITVPQGAAPPEVLAGNSVGVRRTGAAGHHADWRTLVPSVHGTAEEASRRIDGGDRLVAAEPAVRCRPWCKCLPIAPGPTKRKKSDANRLRCCCRRGRSNALKPSTTPPAPRPSVRVDPKVIRKVAPTITSATGAAATSRSPNRQREELPSASDATAQRGYTAPEACGRQQRRLAETASEIGNSPICLCRKAVSSCRSRSRRATRFAMPRAA